MMRVVVVEDEEILAKVLKEKLEKEKESSILYFNLGVIYSRIGKIDLAIEKLNQAVKIKPESLLSDNEPHPNEKTRQKQGPCRRVDNTDLCAQKFPSS